MSTTLDARLAALKDGDTVKWNAAWGVRSGVYHMRKGNQIVVSDPEEKGFALWIIPAEWLILPDPPRAKPGVVYRHRANSGDLYDRCGTEDGQLFHAYGTPRRLPFKLDWIEVPDEQEGR